MRLKKVNARGFSHDLVVVLFVAIFAVAGVGYLVASHADPITANSSVIDVSWPQCEELGSIGYHRFGMVGVTGTKDAFSGNQCLSSMVHHFSQYSLYVVGNYPSKYCSDHNISNAQKCGQNAASNALGHASITGVKNGAAGWWIDTEIPKPGSHQWGGNQAANRAYLLGMWQVLASTGKTVGFYSTPSQWQQITGGWRNNSPTWYATGKYSTTTPNIRGYCHQSFTRSSVKWVQYINTSHSGGIDIDIRC